MNCWNSCQNFIDKLVLDLKRRIRSVKWIVLITDKNIDLEYIKKINHSGCMNTYNSINERYVVEYKEGYIFYDYDNRIKDEYEEDELSNIPFKEPHFIMLTYSSIGILYRVINQSNYPENIYVDNTEGFLGQIKDYIDILSEELLKDET